MKTSNQWEKQVAKARSIPIKDMCQRLGIELTQSSPDREGESWHGVCPMCAGHAPSFHVSPESVGGRGLYFCRDCSNGGDSLSLYMAVRKTSFPETVRALS
jgi:DNA primase